MVEAMAVQRLLTLATTPLTIGSMAERLGADAQAVTVIVTALEKQGKVRPQSHGWVSLP